MKKILSALFLLFMLSSCSALRGWEKHELEDEFGAKTGKISMIKHVDKIDEQWLQLRKDHNKIVLMAHMAAELDVGIIEANSLKIKIDDGEIIELKNNAQQLEWKQINYSNLFAILINDDLLYKIKKGKKIAISVRDVYGTNTLLVTGLKNFNEAYDKIK